LRNHDPYVIEILDVALDVIESLNEDHRFLGASELAERLTRSRTRVFRILRTLESRGYVEYDAESQRYRLGLRFLAIGDSVRERIDLRREAEPILLDLARRTRDSAHLLILHGDHAVTIDRRQGENRLQVASPIGQTLPLYVGASPKILLAHLPPTDRERIIAATRFQAFTKNTITNADDLRRCLEQIRHQGYALDEEDFEAGVYAIGAPVRDDTGRVVAGITITTPVTRYSPKRRQDLIRLVIQGAARLSARLGYQNTSTHGGRPIDRRTDAGAHE
jgi:IclR family KDG regulon transcriptional repressor